MILSVSRRTDIPALYSDWFLERIRAGYVYVPNPMNAHQISKVPLSPDIVDCIVFWSKNPAPLLPRLKELEKYPYYFQFTLNAYGQDLERNLPSIEERIDTFLRLSEKIDLAQFGIGHSHCIDRDRIEKILGKSIESEKDKNQRGECGCIASVDVGM